MFKLVILGFICIFGFLSPSLGKTSNVKTNKKNQQPQIDPSRPPKKNEAAKTLSSQTKTQLPKDKPLIKQATVHGMVCAYCANSIKSKFKKVKSVEKIDVDLESKHVTLMFKINESLPDKKIEKLIKSSGMTMSSIQEIPDFPKFNTSPKTSNSKTSDTKGKKNPKSKKISQAPRGDKEKKGKKHNP